MALWLAEFKEVLVRRLRRVTEQPDLFRSVAGIWMRGFVLFVGLFVCVVCTFELFTSRG
jgi:hypothetical protein